MEYEFLQPILDFLNLFWLTSHFKWIVLTTVVTILTAIMAGIHTGNFKFQKIKDFLYRKILPYGSLYCVYWMIGKAIDLGALDDLVFAVLEAALIADLLESLGELGIKVPQKIANAVKK